MRTTITIEDALVEKAIAVTGISERNALFRHALSQMIERDAAERLIRIGGSDPFAWAPNEGDDPPVDHH